MSAPNSNVLDLKEITVNFGSTAPWDKRVVRAVSNIDLEIKPGETVGLVGESGSGKTTLGRVCLGLQKPSEGSVEFLGRPLDGNKIKQFAGQFAAVLQNPKSSINPKLRISSSIAEPLIIRGGTNTIDSRKKVVEMLKNVGLDDKMADRYPHELSGGQRQRVSIARALITEPRFILFDEAVSALDVSVQAQILNLIADLQARSGFSCLFISHDIAATRYISSRVIVMYRGEIVEDCLADSLYRPAKHPYTRGLQAASGLLESTDYDLIPVTDETTSAGCSLYPRCPVRIKTCAQLAPTLQALGETKVACHVSLACHASSE
jgi:oligopeptide/dipeptide ABC transporter ATP-binding protein